jgi:uncharacterized membrane protein YraQ (UPF0718 family)
MFFLYILISIITEFGFGMRTGQNFVSYFIEMFQILPVAFILVGLFEVWVKKETIQKIMGHESGIKGYLASFALASVTLGGVLMALPMAYSLLNKGARVSIVFSFITASVICRIPMAFVEAYYLGISFTLIRLFVSLPLVILFSLIIERFVDKKTLLLNMNLSNN